MMNTWYMKCNADKGWRQTASIPSGSSRNAHLLVLTLASLQGPATHLSKLLPDNGLDSVVQQLHCIACALLSVVPQTCHG